MIFDNELEFSKQKSRYTELKVKYENCKKFEREKMNYVNEITDLKSKYTVMEKKYKKMLSKTEREKVIKVAGIQ